MQPLRKDAAAVQSRMKSQQQQRTYRELVEEDRLTR